MAAACSWPAATAPDGRVFYLFSRCHPLQYQNPAESSMAFPPFFVATGKGTCSLSLSLSHTHTHTHKVKRMEESKSRRKFRVYPIKSNRKQKTENRIFVILKDRLSILSFFVINSYYNKIILLSSSLINRRLITLSYHKEVSTKWWWVWQLTGSLFFF